MKFLCTLLSCFLLLSLISKSQINIPVQSAAGHFTPEENNGYLTESEWNKIPTLQDYKYMQIQFHALPTEQSMEVLKARGIELLTYIPKNTYYCKVSATYQANRFSNVYVRSVFPLEAAQKIHKRIVLSEVPSHAIDGDHYKLMLTLHPSVNAESYLDVFESMGATILNVYNHQHIAVSILPQKINQLAEHASIQFIGFLDAPLTPDNLVNRTDHRSNVLNTDYGAGRHYDGTGVRVALTDDGFIGPHIDYQGRTFQDAVIGNNGGDHGDHCGGTIASAGNKDPLARGMAPAVKLWVYDALATTNYILDDSLYTSPNTSIDIVSTSYSNGCNVGYNSGAESADRQIRTYKNIMRVFSAGNDGTSNCNYGAGAGWGNITGGIKLAKNLIAVANLTYTDSVANSSSRGPATDGRIKPDVSGVGTNVFSTIEPHDYDVYSGTSMSCPGVAGVFTQLYQAYRELNLNQDPHCGLLKNIMMNTCDDLGNPGPDFKYGYGRINGLRAVKLLETTQYIRDSVSTGNTKTHTITIPANTHRVKIMLNWMDREAAVAADTALVNDLDLKVITPGNTTYLPWVLNHTPTVAALNSNAQRLADHLNNAEQVTIDTVAAGTYTLQVSGYAVPFGPQEYYITYEFIPFDSLEVVYPIGGEAFKPGETQTIRWDAISTGASFSVDYSTDNGSTWNSIATNINPSQLYQNWVVPNVISGACKIRVTRGAVSNTSPSTFNISNIPAPLILLRVCPDTITIRWNSTVGANAYDVFLMGATYMDSIASTIDTVYHYTGLNASDEHWFSVRAKNTTTNVVGRRAVAIIQPPGLMNCILANDAEITACPNPGNTTLYNCAIPNHIIVKATIKNNGLSSITNFPIHYQLDATAAVTETCNLSIAPGALATYSFSAPLGIPASAASYNLHIWTSLAGDAYLVNDSVHVKLNIVNGTVTTLPWSEDFESTTLCSDVNQCDNTDCALLNGLVNEENLVVDQFDWKAYEDDTPTTNTGPSVDHTLGTAAGNYVYLETSYCYNQTGYLMTPCFSFTPGSNANLNYWYHLYGNGMGSLHIDAFVDGEWLLDITPAVVGNQGNTWFQNNISLLPYVNKTVFFRFRGKTGTNQRSDMALDDLKVLDFSAVGVEGFESESSMKVYPNPMSDLVDIRQTGNSEGFTLVELYDAMGKKVKSFNWTTTQMHATCDVRELAGGFYFIEVLNSDKVLYRGKLRK